MSNNQHTPGPWAANDDGLVLGNMDNYEGEAPLVCTCGSADDLNREPELHLANARLIAAAPDLLDVAKKALRELRSINPGPAGDREGNRALLIAAIAKAEGGAA